jgi:DNA-binding CsgD family transcriptional regulator
VQTEDIKKDVKQTVLSPRETEVLQWCSLGKSNSVIATILSISEKTVEYHLTSVFRKLEVNGRMLAVLKAIDLKLIVVEQAGEVPS